MKNKEPGMSLIVKTVTRLTVGLILIYGIYIVLQGHISPGGGFAGGVIIALSFIHILLAFGKEDTLKKMNGKSGLFFAGLGAFLFLLAASRSFKDVSVDTYPTGGFQLFTGGSIPIIDIAVAMMTGAALFVIFLALVLLTGSTLKR